MSESISATWPLSFNAYQFKESGRRYLYCGGSMYLFAVDDLTAKVIQAVTDSTREAILQRLGMDYDLRRITTALDEIASLYHAGILTAQGDPLPVYERDQDHVPAWSDVRDLWLILTHHCNLHCAYCFSRAEYMSEKSQMDEAVALKGIDFLFSHSRLDRELSIVFFGGEPLLRFPLIKAVVAHTKKRAVEQQRKVRYCITTNGVNLGEEVADFLSDNDFNVMVSFDGDRKGHDAVRVFSDGRGSYDLILPRVRYFNALVASSHASSIGRCTLNRGHLGRLPAIYEAMADELGFTVFSTPLIHAPAPSWLTFRSEDLGILEAELATIGDWFVERANATGSLPDIGIFTAFLRILHQRKRPHRGCAAGRQSLCLDVDGTLYPCERFVGLNEYSLGNVRSEMPLPEERIENISRLDQVGPYQKCLNCYAVLYCKGTCMAERIRYQGSDGPPESECELYRLLLRRILSIYVRLDNRAFNNDTAIAANTRSS
jgi:uncharacterized protein